MKGEPRTDEPIYNPDEDKNYYAALLEMLQNDAKTLAKLALLDKDGHPVTHVNGITIDDAWELAKYYGK